MSCQGSRTKTDSISAPLGLGSLQLRLRSAARAELSRAGPGRARPGPRFDQDSHCAEFKSELGQTVFHSSAGNAAGGNADRVLISS